MDKKKLVDTWRAVNEARAKLDLAASEKRDVTAEERQFIDTAFADGTSTLEAIEADARARRLVELSDALAGAVELPQTKARGTTSDGSYEEAFKAYLRGDTKAAGDLQEGTDSEGGYIVPPEFMARLVAKIDPVAPMLGLCSQFQVSTNSVEIPTRTALGLAAWKAEEAAYGEDTVPFNTMSIIVYKATRLQKVSEELLADAAFDVEAILADVFGTSFGVLINAALTTGTGSAQPYGFVTRNTLIKTCANSGGWVSDFDPAKLFEVVFAVPSGYWGRSRWVMNQATWGTLAAKKDSDGRYLLLPASMGGLEGGPAGTLLGHPITLNPAMASMGASQKCLAFGDFSAHYVVRRPGMTIRRLTELYAATGQVGYVANMRLGADLSIVDEPICIGQNAAS